MRSFCSRWQNIFYAPKQISACDNFDLDGAQAEYIFNYTNNLVKLSKDGKPYYFKEARERRAFPAYLKESVDRFFEIYPNPELHNKVLASIRSRSARRKILHMGQKDERRSPLHRYLVSGNERVLGLPSTEGADKEIMRKLIFCLYGEVNNYLENVGVKKGDKQTFLAVRALAVSRLAALLGLGHLIPQTRYIRVMLDGRERVGVLTDEAKGEDASLVPCKERKRRITPQLLGELTSLNVLDLLCFDNDHRVNNYFAVTDEAGNYIGISSFDNDAPNAFLPTLTVKMKHSTNCSNLIKGGKINRPHMDGGLARAVAALNKDSLACLRVYLRRIQFFCFFKRLKKLQRAIARTQRARADFLIVDGAWTGEHIQADLSGKYGKTYLQSFLTDCYYLGGLHPFDAC